MLVKQSLRCAKYCLRMSTFGERFKDLRQQAGLSQRELARRVGVSGAAISQWESSVSAPENIRGAGLERAARELGRSVSYLLTGRGSNRDRVEDGRSEYLRPLSLWSNPADLPADQYVFLPRLEYQLSAGNGGPDPDSAYPVDTGAAFRADYAATKGWTPQTHFTLRAKGESMEPTIQDGAPVVVATNEKTIRSGRIYAILIDSEPFLKRLDKLPGGIVRVRSDNSSNPAFASYEVQEDAIEVIGRAVWTPSEL